MKSLLFTLALICFSISQAKSTSNPWELDKLSIDQVIEMPEIQFEMDEATLTESSLDALVELKNFLLTNDAVVIELQGHTNNVPSSDYCDALSTKRAEAVKMYLETEGVNPNQLIAKGYGKRNPISSNLTPEGRSTNQRVAAKIVTL